MTDHQTQTPHIRGFPFSIPKVPVLSPPATETHQPNIKASAAPSNPLDIVFSTISLESHPEWNLTRKQNLTRCLWENDPSNPCDWPLGKKLVVAGIVSISLNGNRD
ncbi:hypothetical protein E4T56_gene20854 [Termitomyces sp. T112]|nr:hypothetical protein E4T56_gene20854 [Termitomyces sp. T112]